MINTLEILKTTREYRSLNIFEKNQLSQFVDAKLNKVFFKIQSSAFLPYERNDKLNLNRNFREALYSWLIQFPEEHRLGFLCAGLSTIYITQREFDQLFDIAIEKLYAAISEWDEKQGRVFGPKTQNEINEKIRAYPVSVFGAYDNFIHRTQIQSTKDRDKWPSRGVLEETLYSFFWDLRGLAEHGEDFPYSDEVFDRVKQLIHSFLNSYIVLIDDCSFSGTSVTGDLTRLLKLLQIFFNPFQSLLKSNGRNVPGVFILLPFATSIAMTAIQTIANTELRRLTSTSPVAGYVFDDSQRAFRHLPAHIAELNDILPPKIKPYTKLEHALAFFYEQFGKVYLDETNVTNRTALTPKDFMFGYKKGAWTIVTYQNCPNNSLPVLWYPIAGSRLNDISPLFQRTESHITHKSYPSVIDENIEIALADKKGFIHEMLKNYYERNL